MSARRASLVMVGLFEVETIKKDQVLYLLFAGKIWVFSWVLSQWRAGRACCRSSVWTCRCRVAGAFIGSPGAQEQHVRMWNVWCCVLCTQVVWWAAVLCSCVLPAWAVLGWAALVATRDARVRIVRVGAGRRSAWRRALRHWALLCCQKVVFFRPRLLVN